MAKSSCTNKTVRLRQELQSRIEAINYHLSHGKPNQRYKDYSTTNLKQWIRQARDLIERLNNPPDSDFQIEEIHKEALKHRNKVPARGRKKSKRQPPRETQNYRDKVKHNTQERRAVSAYFRLREVTARNENKAKAWGTLTYDQFSLTQANDRKPLTEIKEAYKQLQYEAAIHDGMTHEEAKQLKIEFHFKPELGAKNSRPHHHYSIMFDVCPLPMRSDPNGHVATPDQIQRRPWTNSVQAGKLNSIWPYGRHEVEPEREHEFDYWFTKHGFKYPSDLQSKLDPHFDNAANLAAYQAKHGGKIEKDKELARQQMTEEQQLKSSRSHNYGKTHIMESFPKMELSKKVCYWATNIPRIKMLIMEEGQKEFISEDDFKKQMWDTFEIKFGKAELLRYTTDDNNPSVSIMQYENLATNRLTDIAFEHDFKLDKKITEQEIVNLAILIDEAMQRPGEPLKADHLQTNRDRTDLAIYARTQLKIGICTSILETYAQTLGNEKLSKRHTRKLRAKIIGILLSIKGYSEAIDTGLHRPNQQEIRTSRRQGNKPFANTAYTLATGIQQQIEHWHNINHGLELREQTRKEMDNAIDDALHVLTESHKHDHGGPKSELFGHWKFA